MNGKTNRGRYPCHAWEMEDAKEARKALRLEELKRLGSEVRLEDGTLLHINYLEGDDYGCRRLYRCRVCGGLVMSQSSMDCWDPTEIEADDEYLPVRSPEEAGLLNILADNGELCRLSGRILHTFNGSLCKWLGGGEPVPFDPEELKEKIRQKYAGLNPGQKEMLEDLIRKTAGPESGR